MRRFVTGLLILVSALCLFLSSTSLWVRHNVINTQVFVSNVNTMVDLPQVEGRINDKVTTTVMANPQVQDAVTQAVAVLPPRLQQFKPTVENGIRSLVSAGVGRLLTSDPFRGLTNRAITSAHDQLVAGQPVQFTLGQAKNLVPASAKDGLAGQVLGLLPDNVGVTLLTPADAPQVYNAINLLKSVWWWLGLIALAALAGALAVSRRRRGTLRAWAIATAVLAFVALIALRVTRGQLLVQVKAENRDAVGAIYDVLAGSLRSWTLWLLAIGLFVLVETLVWGRLGIVRGIRRGVAAAQGQIQHRRDQRAAARTAAADGTAPEPVREESWPRRVAVDAQAFVQGMDLDRRAAGIGTLVEAHLRPARWAGIALGAVILLLWPSPTLSVLIWIVALVALYIGALEWLRSRAPAASADQAAGKATGEATGEATLPVPLPRPASDGVPAPALVGARSAPTGATAQATTVQAATAQAPAAEPEPRALAEPVLTPEVLSSLGGRLDLLVRLGQVHEAGVLSDEEFSREKARLLAV
jgi:hypothetical protein